MSPPHVAIFCSDRFQRSVDSYHGVAVRHVRTACLLFPHFVAHNALPVTFQSSTFRTMIHKGTRTQLYPPATVTDLHEGLP
jgi:hypothetical protein